MNKWFSSKAQIKYVIVVLIMQVIINILFIINLLDVDSGFTWSYAYKIGDILSSSLFALPAIVVFFSIIFFKNKWLGLKSLIIALPFIIICYYIMASELKVFNFNHMYIFLFPCIIFLINVVLGLAIIGLSSIVSYVLKH
jgi:hypothetical protein